jgi:hypothetical protein
MIQKRSAEASSLETVLDEEGPVAAVASSC